MQDCETDTVKDRSLAVLRGLRLQGCEEEYDFLVQNVVGHYIGLFTLLIYSLKNTYEVVLYQEVVIREILVLRLIEVSVLLEFIISVNKARSLKYHVDQLF